MLKPEIIEAIDASKNEILTALSAFSSQMDKRFESLVTKEEAKQFATKEDLKQFVTKDELKQIEYRMEALETRMVSKSYLDDKLADLISEQNQLLCKEDNKLKSLIGILYQNRTLSNHNLKTLAVLEPFPEHF